MKSRETMGAARKRPAPRATDQAGGAPPASAGQPLGVRAGSRGLVP